MAAVQSGWLDLDQSPAVGQAINGTQDEWWSLLCNAVNNQIGRDGALRGAKVKLTDYTDLTTLVFAVWRLVSGTNYTLIGMSQEIAPAANGIVEHTFTTPITGVLATDILGMIVRPASGNEFCRGLDDSETLPVENATELATGVMSWHDSGDTTSTIPYSVGTAYDHTGGGATYRIMPIVPMMNAPKVIVVGDSISEGAPLSYTYRRDVGDHTDRDAYAPFAQVAYRSLGWECEVAGDEQGDNHLQDVVDSDLDAALLAKIEVGTTTHLHVHAGVNDINQSRSAAQSLAALESILGVCRTYNLTLIVTSIFPWTGKADNSTGTHAQNTSRDALNVSIKAWAEKYNDVIYCDLNQALGQERLAAKSGDGAPTAGNLWDLQPDYVEADSPTALGVHLSKQGAEIAGGVLAGMLRAKEIFDPKVDAMNNQRARARQNPVVSPLDYSFTNS